MDVIVKVVIDQKEYDRLRDIEQRYEASKKNSERDQDRNQIGHGNCLCVQQKENERGAPDLSQIIAENSEANAVNPPVAGILPSITVARDTTIASHIQPNDPDVGGLNKRRDGPVAKERQENVGFEDVWHPWYYIGLPRT